MTLSSTLPNSVPLSQGDGSVWKAFGISSDSNAQLEAFIALVDPPLAPHLITNPLMVTLFNSGAPNAPNPDSVWCVSTIIQYQITVRLNFQVSIYKPLADTPIGQAISWINEAGKSWSQHCHS